MYIIQISFGGDIKWTIGGVEYNLMLPVLKSLILLEFKRVLRGVVRNRERFIDCYNSSKTHLVPRNVWIQCMDQKTRPFYKAC